MFCPEPPTSKARRHQTEIHNPYIRYTPPNKPTEIHKPTYPTSPRNKLTKIHNPYIQYTPRNRLTKNHKSNVTPKLESITPAGTKPLQSINPTYAYTSRTKSPKIRKSYTPNVTPKLESIHPTHPTAPGKKTLKT